MIHDTATNKFLVSTMSSLAHSGQSFWTSLHKSLNSGFQWLDNTAVQFTNWYSGEPSTRCWGGNLENCSEVFLSDGQWNDEECNSKRRYICEKQQAVDAGIIIAGTGGPPVNIPTPKPFTRPSVLPIQIEPTLPSHQPASQKHPKLAPPGKSTQNLPVVTNPRSTPTGDLPPITVPMYTGAGPVSPLQQGGVTVATTTSVLGMSPGALDGVIIASLAVILLLVLIALYWKRNTAQGRQSKFGLSDGFENKTYRNETVSETRVGLSLRTMCESKS